MSVEMTWPEYQRHECRVEGRVVRLSPHMTEVLSTLLVRYPHPTPKALLIEALWFDDPDGGILWADNQIRVLIGRLRRRIGQSRISTTYRWGYRIEQDAAMEMAA